MKASPYLLLAAILLSSCEVDEKPGYDRRPMLKSLAEELILPRFAAFSDKARALSVAVDRFCSQPDRASLLAAHEAFFAAREPWKRSEVIAFGPTVEAPLRIGPKLDFWPARTRDIDKRLTSADAVDADALRDAGVTVRGLPVLEYLLFDPATDVLAKFLEQGTGARRCDYARGVAEDIASNARALHEAWQPSGGNFVKQLVNPGTGSEPAFEDVQCAASELVDRMVFTVENVRMLKLGKPSGITQSSGVMPELAESRFSDYSLADARATVLGVRELFDGPKNGLGIVVWLDAAKPALTSEIRRDFAAALDALDAIERPFADAIQDQPNRVRAAYDALGDLQRTLGVDMAAALGVSVTFNDTDGD